MPGREIVKKSTFKISIDFFTKESIIIIVRGRWKPRYAHRADESNNSEKNFSKKFEKPLDKCHKMWYNIGTVERGKPPH